MEVDPHIHEYVDAAQEAECGPAGQKAQHAASGSRHVQIQRRIAHIDERQNEPDD